MFALRCRPFSCITQLTGTKLVPFWLYSVKCEVRGTNRVVATYQGESVTWTDISYPFFTVFRISKSLITPWIVDCEVNCPFLSSHTAFPLGSQWAMLHLLCWRIVCTDQLQLQRQLMKPVLQRENNQICICFISNFAARFTIKSDFSAELGCCITRNLNS